MPRPKRSELLGFVGGKALFLSLAFGLPLLVHPLWIVLMFYVLIVGIAGVVVSVVFQLAHCVEEAEFPLPQENRVSMENAWAIHQVETTVDFARRTRPDVDSRGKELAAQRTSLRSTAGSEQSGDRGEARRCPDQNLAAQL